MPLPSLRQSISPFYDNAGGKPAGPSEFYIGIEGFGTRYCAAVVSDSSGQIIRAHRLNRGLTLAAISRQELVITLGELLRTTVSSLGFHLSQPPICTICFSISGATYAYDTDFEFPSFFNQHFPTFANAGGRFVCTGDCEAIFASHAWAHSGSLIVSGLGSRACVFDEGKTYFYGGWGPVLGDDGSGFHIGNLALQSVLKEHDIGQAHSKLWEHIDDHLSKMPSRFETSLNASRMWMQIKSRASHMSSYTGSFDSRSLIYELAHHYPRDYGFWAWRNACASLVIPVMKAWGDGCPRARSVIDRSATSLAYQYKQLISTLPQSRITGPLVLYGGVLTFNEAYRAMVARKISRYSRHVHIIDAHSPGAARPVIGALLFALGQTHTARQLCLPDSNIMATVRSSAKTFPKELSLD